MSHSHSKVSEDTKSLEKPFFSVSAEQQAWQDHLKAQSALAAGWKGSGGRKALGHAAQQESLVTVQVLVTGHRPQLGRRPWELWELCLL